MAEAGCTQAHIDFANQLADAAAAAIRPRFRTQVPVDLTADQSPVTLADREAEAAMRERIAARYPDHGILGEELGRTGLDRELVWVLDPIDGTRAFLGGKPTFGTLVALCRAGRPVLGVLDQPISGERWVGAAGRPTTFQGVEARTRACTEPSLSVIHTTALDYYREDQAAAFARLAAACRSSYFGADCYAFGLLAAGFTDLALECNVQPYDFCALVPIVEGAGGVITDWQGGALELAGSESVLAAATEALHEKARAILLG